MKQNLFLFMKSICFMQNPLPYFVLENGMRVGEFILPLRPLILDSPFRLRRQIQLSKDPHRIRTRLFRINFDLVFGKSIYNKKGKTSISLFSLFVFWL